MYHLDPLEVVGTEGIWGLCLYAIILPILSTAHCTLSPDICVTYPIPGPGKTTYESPALYFLEFGASP